VKKANRKRLPTRHILRSCKKKDDKKARAQGEPGEGKNMIRDGESGAS